MGKVSSLKLSRNFRIRQASSRAGRSSAVPGFPRRAACGETAENFSTLNQRFARLLAIADAADAAPTTQMETLASNGSREARNRRRWGELKRTGCLH